MEQSDTEVEKVRTALRSLARTMSAREIEAATGVSYATIYRFIERGSRLVPQRATLRKLAAFVQEARASEVSQTVANRSVREPGATYTPGPAVGQLPPRARATVLGYLKRLEAAGLTAEELVQMEHLLADPSFAQRFSTSRGGPLSEDDWILLIESTWRAIADTLSLRGVRP